MYKRCIVENCEKLPNFTRELVHFTIEGFVLEFEVASHVKVFRYFFNKNIYICFTMFAYI